MLQFPQLCFSAIFDLPGVRPDRPQETGFTFDNPTVNILAGQDPAVDQVEDFAIQIAQHTRL